MILAFAGGVGGARLANGLASVLPAGSLTVAVNTGDDFEHLGLHISPDPDTVLYTLAGLNDAERGWGLAGETFACMAAVKRVGGEDWFALGDRDLGTHLERTRRLAAGETLSQITADFAAKLGIRQAIIPVTDDKLRTMVHTDAGELSFQDYFVRRRCEPVVTGISFDGAAKAAPSPGLAALMQSPDLQGIIICPSNPFLSIDPILAIPGIRDWLRHRSVPCVAISPLIGGKAVKGPAAKMMAELSLEATPRAIAEHYLGLIDGLIIDRADTLQAFGECHITDTLMRDLQGQERLARESLAYLQRLRSNAPA
jgi:LPPG:FO 2-phospho-L-lactate transferase